MLYGDYYRWEREILKIIFNPKLINEEAGFRQSFQEGLIKIVEEKWLY